MAEYLSQIQWAVRPASVVPPRDKIYDDLLVNTGEITSAEIVKALKSLK